MEYTFDPEKNELLYTTRGVSFPMVIEAIAERGVVLNFPHPNPKHYPGQKVLVVELGGYAYCVPYLDEGDTWVLKTIYPSRKFRYLIEEKRDG